MEAAKKKAATRLVRFQADQRVRYDQAHAVDEATFQKLRELLTAARDGGIHEGRDFDTYAADFIDVTDVVDADDIEDVDVRVSDDGGKTWRDLD